MPTGCSDKKGAKEAVQANPETPCNQKEGKCPLEDLSKYGKSITIEGDDEFKKATRSELDELTKTTTGKNLFKSLDDSGKKITIKKTTVQNGTCQPVNAADANLQSDGKSGSGSDSIISSNPDFKPDGLPNHLVLGHELIHAQHNAYGVRETELSKEGVKKEELKTVGLPPFTEDGLTENSIRKDLKLKKREAY